MRRYGLIGYPLSHSFSGKFFSEKFEREGIHDATYDMFPMADISALPEFIREHQDVCGLNVTIPHKEAVIPFLHEIDEEAKKVGAVNCIKIAGGRMKGFNTDVYGFRISIKPFLENKFERALILGTGGASKAVAHVLHTWGIPFFFISRERKPGNVMTWDELKPEMLSHFPLIINTTPLGTYPDVEAMPSLPYEGIGEKHFLYDLIYNPEESRFLREGRKRGALTMNGKKMLEWQALKSWEIWNSAD